MQERTGCPPTWGGTPLSSLEFAAGLFFASLKLGTGESRDRLGRFYAYYEAPELSDLVTNAGFSVTSQETGQSRGLSGELHPHILMFAHA